MNRTKELQDFIDGLTKSTFGSFLSDSQKKGCCVSCKINIKGFRDELSLKEYGISGLCQKCQDEVFGE